MSAAKRVRDFWNYVEKLGVIASLQYAGRLFFYARKMTEKEREIRQRLKDDFEHYASRCLKIRLKVPKLNTSTQKLESFAPLSLNKAQRYIHERLEEQLSKTGKVRALILKGRQQGCSTYTEGRFFWKVTHQNGVRAFILTHEEDATKNLFEMALRYYENCPALVRPAKHASNAKELEFGDLDSGYRVGTAGNKSAGRSSTIQYFHGSEVAYWPNAEDHAAGVLQAVPHMAGTEIILESTANGLGNYFHKQWLDAEAGISDYIAIFIPWYWQEEYQAPITDDFRLTDDEVDYREAYSLTLEQMAWRRVKMVEMGEWKFRQDYPATAAEAFLTSAENVYIRAESVLKARKGKADIYGAKVIGVDPAWNGESSDDRTAIVIRHGRVVTHVKTYFKHDTMAVAGIVAKLIQDEKPDKVFVDVGGIGAGVYDRLKEMGYGNTVTPVNFGAKPLDPERYKNKRTEMWTEMRDWFYDEPVSIPDIDEFQTDLTAPVFNKPDSLSRPLFYSKEDLKAIGVRSPDLADALALTFAFPINQNRTKNRTHQRTTSNQGWMTA